MKSSKVKVYLSVYITLIISGTILILYQKHCTHPAPNYFGLKLPGETPEIFAPGIVSTGFHEHSFPAFSPDLQEVHWTTVINHPGQGRETAKYFGHIMLEMAVKDGKWQAPRLSEFNSPYQDLEGFVSPDGKKFFFASRRPLKDGGKECGGNNIWVAEKQGDRWGKPWPLNPPVRTGQPQSSPTVTGSGTLYFESVWEGGQYQCGMFRSELRDGKYGEPELLPPQINTSHFDWTPFISPDETYLLFSSNRPGGYGSTDLYVSFRNRDGTWTESINLGEAINSEYEERYPYVSPDRKYLFYTANTFLYKNDLKNNCTYDRMLEVIHSPGNGTGDIYWVDARIIARLKPEETER